MMKTLYLHVDPAQSDKSVIQQAADLIKKEELVAFPTETVYGLGAGAFYPRAVQKIFQVKGRKPVNPLLVHISCIEQVKELVSGVPDSARVLMDRFWPGPLSIILPAHNRVPEIIRGGRSSVGLRMPDHPVALELIDRAGPLAAPSANLSGRPSPVSASHVQDDLDGKIAAILDAGPTGVGLESTLIDLSGSEYRILRRGGTAVEEIEAVLNTKVSVISSERHGDIYNIAIDVRLSRDKDDLKRILAAALPGYRIALVSYEPGQDFYIEQIAKEYILDLGGSGVQLFTILRDAEDLKFDLILFSPLPLELSGTGAAMGDRIRKAARDSFHNYSKPAPPPDVPLC